MKYHLNIISFYTLIHSTLLSLASGDTCLEDWNIATSGCDYESLLTELKNKLPETCGHDESTELQLAFNHICFGEII